jgi:hypothetical protein
VGGATFREPRTSLVVPSANSDLDTKTLEPVRAQVTLEGCVRVLEDARLGLEQQGCKIHVGCTSR